LTTALRRAAILGAGVLGACAAPDPPAPVPPEVTVATPVRRDVVDYRDFTGETVAYERAEVRARVAGFLTEMEFVPSQMVRRGSLLFVIEQEPYRAQLQQAEATLRSAEANRDRARSDLDRLEEAVKTNAVSQQEVTRARAELSQAEASVLSAQAGLAQAKIQLDYTEVRSPVSGMVGRNLVDLGNLVGQGEATLLTTVARLDPMYVYFDLPESLVLRLRADLRGMGVQTPGDLRDNESARQQTKFFLGTQIDEGFPHEGHLDFISNSVNAATGTIEVRGVVPNPDRVLLPGVFVRVRVPGRLLPNAVLVEERALGTDLGGKYVMTVGADGLVEQRYIELGRRQEGGLVVVDSGLDGSETYIVGGMLRARPGFPVSPTRAEPAESGS
jgi:RND family efflux transporter MFP subunit